MLIPTMRATKVGRRRGDITEADEKYVLQAIREIVEDLGHGPENKSGGRPSPEGAAAGDDVEPGRRSGSSATRPTTAEHAALEMLRNLLDPCRWNIEVLAARRFTAELLDQVAEKRPDLVCLVATPPGGLAHIRYLCKRLRARFPDLKIVVCRWTGDPSKQSSAGHIVEAGADVIAATLLETRQQLASLLPVLTQAHGDHTSPSRRDPVQGRPHSGTEERSAATRATVTSSQGRILVAGRPRQTPNNEFI